MPKCEHGCSPVNLLHIFRAPLLQNNSRRLPLNNETFGRCAFLESSQISQEHICVGVSF